MHSVPGIFTALVMAQADVAAAVSGTPWFVTLIAFLVMLGILVFFHELGHFLVAIWMGIKVEEFAIGFPPRATTLFEYKGVQYTLNWLPLGGFVRFGGEDNAIYGTGSLTEAPPWRKIPVMAAGPLMNLFLGIIIFAVLFLVQGIPFVGAAHISNVFPDTPAEAAQFQEDDVLLRLAGEKIDTEGEIEKLAQEHAGTPVEAVVLRDGEEQSLMITPSSEGKLGIAYEPVVAVEGTRVLKVFPDTPAEAAGLQADDVLIRFEGLSLDNYEAVNAITTITEQNEGNPLDVVVQRGDEQLTFAIAPETIQLPEDEKQRVVMGFRHNAQELVHPIGLPEAIVTGVLYSGDIVLQMIGGLVDMIRGALGLTDTPPAGGVAGPIGIARATGEVIDLGGWPAFFRLMALLSINLFLLNLLPIPALDGSHIVFSLIEWVRGGKKVPPEKEAMVHMIGFATLMVLMVLVSVSDLLNAIRGTSVLGGG